MRALQPALEAGKYGVTVAVHEGHQVIAVWPGLHDKAYGVAIDVGSTTIAGHLADLADGAVVASNGVMNPQIRFGEDLMSRVSYAMMHPEGAGEMTRGRAQGPRRADRLAGDAGGHRAGRHPRADDRRQPDHAPPRPGHRPDAARWRAVRAGHRPRGQDHRGRARTARQRGRPGLPAAVHRRPRRRRHRRRDPRRGAASGRAHDPGRRRRHERRDRPGRQASAARRIEPDRARVRGRPVCRWAARGARRHRARPHRPGHARAALPGHRRRRVVRRARLRRGGQSTGITGVCGSGSSRSSPNCSSPA